MNAKTTQPGDAEFMDTKSVSAHFGLCSTHLFLLRKAGTIKSVSIRKPGAVRGKRLFDVASIRAYLNSLAL